MVDFLVFSVSLCFQLGEKKKKERQQIRFLILIKGCNMLKKCFFFIL